MARTSDLIEIGTFDESLFIDCVDHDICLRLRRHDKIVFEATALAMSHSIGDATRHRKFGIWFTCTNHSAIRRYYMTRNQLEVSRRNLFFDPLWSVKGVLQLVSGLVAVLLFEENKSAKFRAAGAGFFDFFRRRFGPCPISF